MEEEKYNKVSEPAAAYYTNSVVGAMRRHISRRIATVNDPSFLSRLSQIVDDNPEPFEVRYQRAREFAYAHFPYEIAKQLEAEDFMIDQPMPNVVDESKIDSVLLESENSGTLSDTETQALFNIWNRES